MLVKNREIVNPAVKTRDVLIALFGLINIIKIISKYNRICFFDIKNSCLYDLYKTFNKIKPNIKINSLFSPNVS